MFQKQNLRDIMDVGECHVCRSQTPRDAGTFDLRTNQVRKSFNGNFKLTLLAACTDRSISNFGQFVQFVKRALGGMKVRSTSGR